MVSDPIDAKEKSQKIREIFPDSESRCQSGLFPCAKKSNALLMVCVLKLYDVQLMKTRVVHARDAAGRYHLSAMGIDPPPPLVY